MRLKSGSFSELASELVEYESDSLIKGLLANNSKTDKADEIGKSVQAVIAKLMDSVLEKVLSIPVFMASILAWSILDTDNNKT